MLRFLVGLLLLTIAFVLVQEVVIDARRGVRVAHSVTRYQKTRIAPPRPPGQPERRVAQGRVAPLLTRDTYSTVHPVHYPKAGLALLIAAGGTVLLIRGTRREH